jgi:hypothetical protein
MEKANKTAISATAVADTRQCKSFEEFWPHYLRAHSRPETRALHLLGTTVGGIGLVSGILSKNKKYLALALIGSYGSAWLGHYAFEKNSPATFKNPLWSLQADLKMYQLWLSGGLDAELRRVGVE